MNRFWLLPIRAPRLTLAAVLGLTGLLAILAARIQVDSSIENLLPAEDPNRAYYRQVRELFGSEEITVIGVFADDVFAPATLEKIDRLTDALSEIDGVHEVVSLTNVKGVEMGEAGLRVGRLMRALPESREAAE